MEDMSRRNFNKLSMITVGGYLASAALAQAQPDATVIEMEDPILSANASDPPPIRLLSPSSYTFGVEGTITPLTGDPTAVEVRDTGLDIDTIHRFPNPVPFSVPNVVTVPGKRTCRIRVLNAGGLVATKTFDFVALPRRFKLDLSTATIGRGAGTCEDCNNLNRVHFLDFNPNFGRMTSSPKLVWTAAINPPACNGKFIRLDLRFTNATEGVAVLRFLPRISMRSPDGEEDPLSEARRMIRYKDPHWNYNNVLRISLPQDGATLGCRRDWPNPIVIESA